MVNGAGAAGALVGGFIIFFVLLWIVLIGAAIFAFVFWILMLIDVAKRQFKQENDKTMWILIVVLTGIVGALIYYFMVKKQNKH